MDPIGPSEGEGGSSIEMPRGPLEPNSPCGAPEALPRQGPLGSHRGTPKGGGGRAGLKKDHLEAQWTRDHPGKGYFKGSRGLKGPHKLLMSLGTGT